LRDKGGERTAKAEKETAKKAAERDSRAKKRPSGVAKLPSKKSKVQSTALTTHISDSSLSVTLMELRLKGDHGDPKKATH